MFRKYIRGNHQKNMIQTKKLYNSIMTIYPGLAEQSIDLVLHLEEEQQEWSVNFKLTNHHLKTYISMSEAENLILGKPCESLELQLNLISQPIN